MIVSNKPDSNESGIINQTKESISGFGAAQEILLSYGNSTLNVAQQGEYISIYFRIL